MEIAAGGERDDFFAGLIVACDADQYFAIGWEDLLPHRVPAAWVAAVAALVRGEEPAGGGADVRGLGAADARSAAQARLLEAAAAMRGPRLAAQRLEAWALFR